MPTFKGRFFAFLGLVVEVAENDNSIPRPLSLVRGLRAYPIGDHLTRHLFLFLGNFLIYSLNKPFKLYPALRLRLLSLGGEHAELFAKPGNLDILHLAGGLKPHDLPFQVFVDGTEYLELCFVDSGAGRLMPTGAQAQANQKPL